MPLWMPRSSRSSPSFSSRSSVLASACETSVKTAMLEPQDVPDALLAAREALAALRRPAAAQVVRLDLVRRHAGLGLHGDVLRLPAHAQFLDAVAAVLDRDALDLLVAPRIDVGIALDRGLREDAGGKQGQEEETRAHGPIVGSRWRAKRRNVGW